LILFGPCCSYCAACCINLFLFKKRLKRWHWYYNMVVSVWKIFFFTAF